MGLRFKPLRNEHYLVEETMDDMMSTSFVNTDSKSGLNRDESSMVQLYEPQPRFERKSTTSKSNANTVQSKIRVITDKDLTRFGQQSQQL